MAKTPLFSTYRKGENRVTASMLAVFERIDLGLVERLLAVATEESSLAFVSFVNQAAGKESIPDAAISANFRYIFETKTKRNALDAPEFQLESHLRMLDGRFASERLIVLTPDAETPTQVTDLGDERVIWLSFEALSQAIESLLADPAELISEQTRFLLGELQSLFYEDGLIGQNDVVVVAARKAWPEYLKYSAYICQPGRSFRQGIERFGFYTEKAIQPLIPVILARFDNLEFAERSIAQLRSAGTATDAKVADLIQKKLGPEPAARGLTLQVFLLSGPDQDVTLRLAQPILHNRPTAWTQNQRYTRLALLEQGPTTTADLDG